MLVEVMKAVVQTTMLSTTLCDHDAHQDNVVQYHQFHRDSDKIDEMAMERHVTSEYCCAVAQSFAAMLVMCREVLATTF